MEEKKQANIGTPYDDVFRTLVTDSDVMTRAFISEMFKVKIDPKSKKNYF